MACPKPTLWRDPVMKQVLQNLRDGSTVLETIPVPVPAASEVLIRTACSLVSAGTEKMLVDFGKASLLDKARRGNGCFTGSIPNCLHGHGRPCS